MLKIFDKNEMDKSCFSPFYRIIAAHQTSEQNILTSNFIYFVLTDKMVLYFILPQGRWVNLNSNWTNSLHRSKWHPASTPPIPPHPPLSYVLQYTCPIMGLFHLPHYLSLPCNVVDLRYFKLWILLHQIIQV